MRAKGTTRPIATKLALRHELPHRLPIPMRLPLSLLALLLATGCLEVGLPTDSVDGGADAQPDDDDEGDDDATPIAHDCVRDPVTSVELCAALSACPDVWVERDRFPHCGFRNRAGVIDLVCACDGFICSMGLAATCQQAKELLATQSELAVCMQVHEGRCLEVEPQQPPTDPKCDPVCISECAGAPSCYELCC